MERYGSAPNFLAAIDAFRQGRQDARQSRLADLAERGRQLTGEVLAGNRNKLAELYQVDPEAGMKVEQVSNERHKQFVQDFTRAAYAATTPQQWKTMIDGYKAQGHQFDPGEDDFANRDALISRGLDVADQMGLDLRRKEANKPPAAVQEFEYGQTHPGFNDYQQSLKRAGAVTINNGQPAGETQYQKTIGEQLAKRWGSLAEEGDTAQEELSIIGQLRNVMPQGGMMTGIAGKLAEWGIGDKNMGDLQATQALVDRLTPKQRVPGSGTSSDLDVRMFKSGMPSLWRTPEGNGIVMDTMEALALNKQARGQIAYQVMDGTMTRQQAVEAYKKLPDPFARFKEYRKRPAAGQDRGPQRSQGSGKGDKNAPLPGTLRTKNGVEWSVE